MVLVNTFAYDHRGKIGVLHLEEDDLERCRQLAERLEVPLITEQNLAETGNISLFLSWRDGKLKLLERSTLKKGGLSVDFDVRSEEQRSWPAPKKGPLSQAIGRKTKTVVDATTGWGQDSFFIFRMGYQVLCLERSLVMEEMLKDGFKRLSELPWMVQLGIQPPQLRSGNAIELLRSLEFKPDCIYLDPMFPPKRKKSALAKKSMVILRDLLGNDEDRGQLFSAALAAAGKRVVVKSPDYADPLGEHPSESFQGKLVRYDVYLI